MQIIYSLVALLATSAVEVAAAPSSGCGKTPTTLKNGKNTIDVNGVPRQFILNLPSNYDKTKPYRVIFTFHATGGSANGTAKGYDGLLSRAGGTSILVSPQGQVPTAEGGTSTGIMGMAAKSMTGWWRTGGRHGPQDLNFVDKMVEAIDADLCVDTRLRFATGFSFGGVMSYSLACARADKFRAVSAQSGANFDVVIAGMSKQSQPKQSKGKQAAPKAPGACKKTDSFSQSYGGIDPSKFLDQMLLGKKQPGSPFVCGNKPIAFMGSMGICDGWIEYGRQARDEFLKINGCKPKQVQPPTEGSKQRVQTTYECGNDTPVVWAEFDGAHAPTREGEAATWEFFSQFK
jgi:poly(3-hydroxybutyrate) depolymerase